MARLWHQQNIKRPIFRLSVAILESLIKFAVPTQECWESIGSSSVGRASPCQGEGREFESRFPLNTLPLSHGEGFVFFGRFRLTGNCSFPRCSMRNIAQAMADNARVVKLVDTQDLKSCGQKWLCGFKSRPGYFMKPSCWEAFFFLQRIRFLATDVFVIRDDCL